MFYKCKFLLILCVTLQYHTHMHTHTHSQAHTCIHKTHTYTNIFCSGSLYNPWYVILSILFIKYDFLKLFNIYLTIYKKITFYIHSLTLCNHYNVYSSDLGIVSAKLASNNRMLFALDESVSFRFLHRLFSYWYHCYYYYY